MTEEYKYVLYSPRADYGIKPRFVDTNSLAHTTGFTSLYAVTAATAKAIEQAGSAKGFKGVVWSERLWLDIDGYERADATEGKLNELGYDYVAFDSGGRGAHFGVRRDAAPSHLLPYQDKRWVEENFPEADTSIYTHLHPFRLPGTTHERTGRIKQKAGEKAGSALILPPFNNKLPQAPSGFLASSGARSIFDVHFITRNSEPCKAGERHQTLIRLIYALRDNGYDVNIARWWVGEVNKRFSPPKEDYEIEKALGSIYR